MTDSPNHHQESKEDTSEQTVCVGCPDTDKCRQVWSRSNRGPFTSGGLLISSILVFLFPILCAILGGIIYRIFKSEMSSSRGEIIAAGVGLLAGVFIAWLLMPFIKNHFSQPENQGKIKFDEVSEKS